VDESPFSGAMIAMSFGTNRAIKGRASVRPCYFPARTSRATGLPPFAFSLTSTRRLSFLHGIQPSQEQPRDGGAPDSL
jgi:hypothetical protein